MPPQKTQAERAVAPDPLDQPHGCEDVGVFFEGVGRQQFSGFCGEIDDLLDVGGRQPPQRSNLTVLLAKPILRRTRELPTQSASPMGIWVERPAM